MGRHIYQMKMKIMLFFRKNMFLSMLQSIFFQLINLKKKHVWSGNWDNKRMF